MRTNVVERNLQEFTERRGYQPTKEDIINILNIIPIYLESVEDKTENEDNKEKTKKETKAKKTVKAKKETKRKKDIKPQDALSSIKKLMEKTGKVPSMNQIKEAGINVSSLVSEYGGWKNVKKSLSNGSEEDQIFSLMEKLNKIPTREDLKQNNISIEQLMNQYGSWREIKNQLHISEKYETMLVNKLTELKNTENLTMENCKAHNIDIAFLIRKYGGWKEVLKNFNLK